MKDELIVDGQKYIREDLCKQDVIYVPKKIGLWGTGRDNESIHIMNPQQQFLYKDSGYESYGVMGGLSDQNSGKNYKLVKVDKPKAGKIYFISGNADPIDCTNELWRYKLYLTDSIYCYWDKSFGFCKINICEMRWKHYYEVVRVDN